MKKNISIFLIAIGIILVLIAYNQKKEKVYNFQKNNSNITIIDLSEEKTNYFNYYLISGVMLIAIGSIMYINLFQMSDKENKVNIFEKLTIQERKIIHFISEGKTNKEIANELTISLSTIKTHINNIYKKTGITSRTQLLNSLKK